MMYKMLLSILFKSIFMFILNLLLRFINKIILMEIKVNQNFHKISFLCN